MGIEQNEPYLDGTRRIAGDVAKYGQFPKFAWVSFLLIMIGSGMQGYANGTIDAFFVGISFLIAGAVLVCFLFPDGKSEVRVFLMTYAMCVLTGGLAQCYSLMVFGNVQSTVDAYHAFFPRISAQPPFTTMADMPINFNARLAVIIWQQVYKLAWISDLDFGPYTGVMLNALVMGVTGSITVRTARELFGNDIWRLRRVGTLFAFCGLFILFGSVLIRDCFTTFFNALVLWGIVRWMVRRTPGNLFFALLLTAVSAYAMLFLRITAVFLFGVFWVLVILFLYFLRRMNITRLVFAIFVLFAIMAANSYVANYAKLMQDVQTSGMEGYSGKSQEMSGDASLGMRLVVNQPLPIRLVAGSGTLMISPIPLWAYSKIGMNDYLLIKGYHGIYQVLVLPLVFVGFFAVYRIFRRDRERSAPVLFLAVYLLVNLFAVVATSLEQRHLAQFMPAFIILAALPDTRREETWKEVRNISNRWFMFIILAHVAWAVLKG